MHESHRDARLELRRLRNHGEVDHASNKHRDEQQKRPILHGYTLLQTIGDVKTFGDLVASFKDQPRHDLPHLGGHSKPDLETAIGDEVARTIRPLPQHRCARTRPGPKTGPAPDHLGPAKLWHCDAGAFKHRVQLSIRVCGARKYTLCGGADRDRPVNMRNDMQAICKKLRQPYAVHIEQSCLPFDRAAHSAFGDLVQRVKASRTGCPQGCTRRRIRFWHHRYTARRQSRCKRITGFARVDMRTEAVANEQTGWALNGPTCRVRNHLPNCFSAPQVRRGNGPRSRQCLSPSCNGLNAPCKPIPRVVATRRCNLGPKTVCQDQAFKLELLLGVPILRHMGGQGADNSARCTSRNAPGIDDLNRCAGLHTSPCGTKPEYPSAPDRDVHACQAFTFPACLPA